jgi:DNA-binding response OmpR family regulator
MTEVAQPRILVVEDDDSILLGLRMNLEREGYEVGVSRDGEEGLARIRDERWDLVILDVMLPRLNGYEVLVALRGLRRSLAVVMLSARSSEVDKVMGLDLGAVDYVSKPFSLPELLARVRAALRRAPPPDPRWRFGSVEVDPGTREVSKEGRPVALTASEFEVLSVLWHAHGRILGREQILEAVRGVGHHGTLRTIDNFVAQIRAKLEDDPQSPSYLITVRGAGYRLVR